MKALALSLEDLAMAVPRLQDSTTRESFIWRQDRDVAKSTKWKRAPNASRHGTICGQQRVAEPQPCPALWTVCNESFGDLSLLCSRLNGQIFGGVGQSARSRSMAVFLLRKSDDVFHADPTMLMECLARCIRVLCIGKTYKIMQGLVPQHEALKLFLAK